MGYMEAFFQLVLMDLFMFKVGLLDFESELAGNGLELMAKGMRTQPTSRNSIPTSQNLNFGCPSFFCLFVCMCHVFWNPKPCFSNYT